MPVQRRLEGKVALVTGGTMGIGAGTVRRLAAEGARVVFTGSNAEAAAAVSEGIDARFVPHRVQHAGAYAPLAAMIAADYGRLDLAFANAGTESGDGSIESIGIDGWNNVLGVNLTGVMLTVQMAVGLMKANPEGPTGSIVINSSMNAHRAMGNFMAYSVTKSAVVALAKSVAVHCAQSGYRIRCNAILPGVVETPLIMNLIAGAPDPAAARAAYEGMAPMKRMAQVEEIAAMVAFLAGDETAFVSGAEFTIDGATTAGMMGV